jgi:hypothetical protein
MAKNGLKMLTDLRDLWWIWAPGCQLVGKPEYTAMSKWPVLKELIPRPKNLQTI